MSKMKEVAALLDVEIGEEFEITKDPCTYRITEHAMERKDDGHPWVVTAGIELHDVLREKARIIKKPWKPKINEKYFMCVRGNVCEELWHHSTIDLMNYATGNCFKTKNEAKAHREEIIDKLRKIYDEGKPLMEAI